MIEAAAVETTHRGKLFTVEVRHYRDASGGTYTREIARHPGAVLVVPVLDDEHIIMIRNGRVAVNQTLWELPAGKLEPDEAPAEAAARELIEETGYEAANLRPLGEFYTSPGFTDELMHAFVAQSLIPVPRQLQDGEEIEVHTVTKTDALAMALDGTLRDGKSIAALLMWDAMNRTGRTGLA